MQTITYGLYTNTYGNKVVIRYLSCGIEHALTYTQLKTYAQQLGQLLINFSPQSVISILHNCPEWDIIDFACYQSKVTHVSLHPLSEFSLLEKVITEIKPAVVFVSHKFNTRYIHIILKKNGLKSKVIPLQNRAEIETFYAELNQQINPITDRAAGGTESSFLQTVIYTSGSTGIAKGVMLSDRNISAAINIFSKARFLDDCKIALSLLPVSLSGERKLNYTYKARGITICYPNPQQSIEESLLLYKPDIVAVVPYLLEKIKSLIAKSAPGNYGFLKAIVCGGASIPLATHQFFKKINIPLYELYGLTETASVLSFNDKNSVKLGTVGKVPPGVKVKIADDGEILCQGENVTSGYLNDMMNTQLLFTADGWLKTGDTGEIDNKGFIKITGRKKNIFKISRGIYVSPEELENKIEEHPLIEHAIVSSENNGSLNVSLLLNEANENTSPETVMDLTNWVIQCNTTFKLHERIEYMYPLYKNEWEPNNIQTLSMKINRVSVSGLISKKKAITLYSQPRW